MTLWNKVLLKYTCHGFQYRFKRKKILINDWNVIEIYIRKTQEILHLQEPLHMCVLHIYSHWFISFNLLNAKSVKE